MNSSDKTHSQSNSKKYGRVFAFGEILSDFITHNGVDFVCMPGGSVVNAALTLSSTDAEVFLVADLCSDALGKSLQTTLHSKGIDTRYCNTNDCSKSNLAIAFLDENKVPTYSFYKDSPVEASTFKVPEFLQGDILLFGSGYAVLPSNSRRIKAVVEQAVQSGCIVYYDVNVRELSADKRHDLRPLYIRNMLYAHVVKGSIDDFFLLFDTTDPDQIYLHCKPYCKNLILTNGAKEVSVFTPYYEKKFDVPGIEVVSTIGAGDNFNAGCIFAIRIENETIEKGSSKMWERIIQSGIDFATHSCKSIYNYINFDELEK